MTAQLHDIAREFGVDLDDDLDVGHVVCHCTSYDISWCRLDVSGDQWAGEGDPLDCPMCNLEEERAGGVCPWGCACDECVPTGDGQ